MLTVSFHKFGDFFFPGTGDLKDVGEVRQAASFQPKPGTVLGNRPRRCDGSQLPDAESPLLVLLTMQSCTS